MATHGDPIQYCLLCQRVGLRFWEDGGYIEVTCDGCDRHPEQSKDLSYAPLLRELQKGNDPYLELKEQLKRYFALRDALLPIAKGRFNPSVNAAGNLREVHRLETALRGKVK